MWLDECAPTASSSSAVTLQKWYLTDHDDLEWVIFGTIEDDYGTMEDSVSCIQFAKWTNWAPYVAQAGVNYFTPMLGDKDTSHKLITI